MNRRLQSNYPSPFIPGLGENLGADVEPGSAAGDGPHVRAFEVGVAQEFGRHLQLDAGAHPGVSRAAPDARFFAGRARRF